MTMHPLHLFACCPRCGSRSFEENDEKSKRCGECGFTYYLNPSAANVAVIRNGRGDLLVVRRAKEPARGTLDLPGGFCDRGETAEQGVAREVAEETGLEVERTTYLFSLPNNYLYSGFVVPTLDMFFECRVAAGCQPRAMDDAGEVMWLPMDRVRPEEFGLASIRKGVERLILQNNGI